MIKRRFVEWAFDALKDYIEENGQQLLAELITWLESLLLQDEETFSAPSPVPGREGWCQARLDEYAEMQHNEGN